MAIALAASQDHIATVFDSADSFVIVESENTLTERIETLPPGLTDLQMIKILRDLKITVLLCGAISGYSLQLIEGANIIVIPFLKGNLKDVAAGFFAGRLDDPAFYLPGCRRVWARQSGALCRGGMGADAGPGGRGNAGGKRRRGKL